MKRRVGRYTKGETAELLRLYDGGFSVYKICRTLNRSQKSIRNNLIRLGKIDGEITPKRYSNSKNLILATESDEAKIIGFVLYFLILFLLTSILVIFPQYNLLEIVLINLFYS
tara:strand:+ start:8156 stop:8494 length:339 start_codon:yes stop_codon:yes gene_type:complete